MGSVNLVPGGMGNQWNCQRRTVILICWIANGSGCLVLPQPPPPPAPPAETTSGTTGGSNTGSKGYTQAWLRGPGDFVAHAHEGLELADASGFVAVGETSDESNFGQILVTRVDTEGNKVWSQKIGTQLSAAHTVVESGSNVIVGGGLYKASTGKMQATLMALDSATGSTVWSTSLDHSGHGAIR